MAQKPNRYKELEQLMTVALIASAILFVLYLICAIAGILWLKVVMAIITMLFCLAGLAFLFLTNELLRQRSLWMTTGFVSVFLCLVVSLILNFP